MKFFAAIPISTIWFFVLLLTTVRTSHACIRLANDSWDDLVYHLNRAQMVGFIMLCPFHIEGSACPSEGSEGYEIGYEIESFRLHVYCAYWWGGSGDSCTINCPVRNNHFVIGPGAMMSMDGMTLRGAMANSVWVKPRAYFQAMACTFEQNGFDDSGATSLGGAAVLVDSFGYADLLQCNFHHNKGSTGGAIRNLGEVILSGGTFFYNEGEQGGAIHNTGSLTVNQARFAHNEAISDSETSGGQGGAIFTSNDLLMVGSTFEYNFAREQGGALFARGTVVSRFTLWKFNHANEEGPAIYGEEGFFEVQNEGCGNTLTKFQQSSNSECNGIAKAADRASVSSSAATACQQFANICQVPPSPPPTEAPSLSPAPSGSPSLSPQPSLRPSQRPSTQPSEIPSDSPSEVPSPAPTVTTHPSLRPSQRPSSFPSSSPSSSPSSAPIVQSPDDGW